MELIDIGVNLAHDSFDGDRKAVIERARVAGVVQMIVTGATEDSTRKAIDLARSEERRVGKECLSVCRSRWSPYH